MRRPGMVHLGGCKDWSVSSCIQIRWICRIALRRRVFNTTPMSAHAYIAARVPLDLPRFGGRSLVDDLVGGCPPRVRMARL